MTNFGDPRLPERFWSKCVPEPNTGCWLWLAALSNKKYGFYKMATGSTRAHKVAYEVLVGPVPDGLVLDHRRCDTPSCVNPDHLEPKTDGENIRRSSRYCGNRTHCKSGHEFTPENTRLEQRRTYVCRICRRCRYISSITDNARRRSARST